MEKFSVLYAGTNDNGFGVVTLENMNKDNGKPIYYSTGQKAKPDCYGGDVITATLGKNTKGYPQISNIKVVEGGDKKPSGGGSKKSYGGGSNRDPEVQDSIMRQSAVKAAIDNKDAEADLQTILRDADILFNYYKDGTIPTEDELAGE